MIDDCFGLATSGDENAVALYGAAIQAFLEYRLDAAAHLKAALAADPVLPMGLVMRGTMLMQLSTNAVAGKVDQAIAAADAVVTRMNARERQHLEALRLWRQGRIGSARGVWAGIVADHPRDLLALRLHHFMSFWQGDRVALRDLPAQALGRFRPHDAGYGFVLGMHAFGLEEAGEYAAAERAGRASVEANPDDLWALHAVAHVMEMQGRAREGADWLARPDGTWSERNPFKDHVWWHAALFSLELGDRDRALDLYDRELRVDESGFYLDVQNAASFLLRLGLAGVDVGDRWQPLADLAEVRIGDHAMAFTDLHYMLALVGAGRMDAARRYLDSLRQFGAIGEGDMADTARDLTVPIASGLLAYGENRHGEAALQLEGFIDRMAPIGGSHAQQDIFRLITIDAVRRSGELRRAQALLKHRLRHRPSDGIAKAMLAAAG
jgi:tetratricopeptide (TPR) repeat protein